MGYINKNNFLTFVNNKYGTIFSFSKSIYKNSITKLEVICKKNNHSNFFTPSYIISREKIECQQCKKDELKNEIENKIRIIYKNKYDCSKINYENNLIPMIFTCKEHGEFKKTSYEVINKKMICPKCAPRIKKEKRNTKSFVKELKNIFKDENYDYSLVKYTKYHSKDITIICKEHGNFISSPDNLLRSKNGCSKCNKKQLLNKEIFLERSNNIHKNYYQYKDNDSYRNRSFITIICKKHGEFKQTIVSHLSGANCFKCTKELKSLKTKLNKINLFNEDLNNINIYNYDLYLKKYNLELNEIKLTKYNKNKFINEFNKIFKNKYDYSLLPNLISMRERIEVVCPNHGVFTTTPLLHKRGNDCDLCNKEKFELDILNLKYENWLDEAKKKFKKYDFSLSKDKYVNLLSVVEVICPKHGNFSRMAREFREGKGCQKCSYERLSIEKTIFTKDWKKESSLVHNNKYDYSLIIDEKINYSNHYPIICKEHGVFHQHLGNHKNSKSGCPKCSTFGFQFDKSGILYYILIDGKYYKIGITNKSIKERFTKDFDRIKVIKEWYYDDGEECYNMEQYYLKEFEWAKVNNVNILKNGNTELFDRDILCLDT